MKQLPGPGRANNNKMRIGIYLNKYSDWLEAYSVLAAHPEAQEVHILHDDSGRCCRASVEPLFEQFKQGRQFSYEPVSPTHEEVFDLLCAELRRMRKGDVLAAPYTRLTHTWRTDLHDLAKNQGVVRVQLSEAFPDTIPALFYEISFNNHVRWGATRAQAFWRSIKFTPWVVHHAYRNVPELCYFELAPELRNRYVRRTEPVVLPELPASRREWIEANLTGPKRTLLLPGAGYDLQKMVAALGLTRYVATSKARELHLDGQTLPLEWHLCAEEVILAGCVDRVVGYPSLAFGWARRLGIEKLECYDSADMSKALGLGYGFWVRRALRSLGVEVKKQREDMMCHYSDVMAATEREITAQSAQTKQ